MYLKKHYFLLLLLLFVPLTLFAIDSGDDIQVGGVYKMYLTTGDILEGVVESKDESSLIMESQGRGYTFRYSIIRNFELIKAPVKKSSTNVSQQQDRTIITFDDLYHRNLRPSKVAVTLTGGRVFEGAVETVEPTLLKLRVGTALIPIAKTVIATIKRLDIQSNISQSSSSNNQSSEVTLSPGPLDSVYLHNPKTDDYGRRLAPILLEGRITGDQNDAIVFTSKTGQVQTIKRNKIHHMNRHSENKTETMVRKYSLPLMCPDGTAYIDIPFTDPSKPFFKVCVDKYEAPNQYSANPTTNISFQAAKTACENQGKRLCSVDEWKYACGGIEQYHYPYGYNLDMDACNYYDNIEGSGLRSKCVGKFGVYDMVGNVFEWVVDDNGQPKIMGGPKSKCQTVSPGNDTRARPLVGYRCCKSN